MIRSQSPAPRGGAALAALASRLTDRDRRVALDCYEHRVLATEQLRRLHFRGSRTRIGVERARVEARLARRGRRSRRAGAAT